MASAGATAESEPETLKSLFRERTLKISTMDRALRYATFVALGCICISALLVLIRNVAPATISIGVGSNMQKIGLPYFIGALGLLSIGLGYLTAAAALTRPRVGAPVLAVMLLGIAIYTGSVSTGQSGPLTRLLPRWAAISSRGLLIALVLLTGATFWVNKQNHARHALRKSHVIVLAGFVAIFIFYWMILAHASPTIGGEYIFGPVSAVLLSSISLLFYPMLQVAAVDFGEWGQLIAQRFSAPLRDKRRGEVILALLLCAALAIYGLVNIAGPLAAPAGRGVLFVAAVCLLAYLTMLALKLHGRTWPETLGFASLFAVSALVTWIVIPLSGFLNGDLAYNATATVTHGGHFAPGADVFSAVGGSGKSRFTMLLPAGWTKIPDNRGLAAYSESNPQKYESIVVAVSQQPATMAAVLKATRLEASRPIQDGDWQVVVTRDPHKGLNGFLWLRNAQVAGTHETYLVTDDEAGFTSLRAFPLFAAITNSFRGADEAPVQASLPVAADTATAAHGYREYAYQAGVSLLIILLTFGLIASGRFNVPLRVVGTALLFGMVTAMFILISFSSLGRFLFGQGARWPAIGEFEILFGIGAVGLVGLLAAQARHHDAHRWAQSITGLIGAVVALDLMYRLYNHLLRVDHSSVWAAMILLVAVSWEVLMSGNAITNQGSRLIPRSSRVLGFLGYAIIVCGAVLFFSAQTSPHGPSEPFFVPESVTQAALFEFALPLFVLMLFLRHASGPRAESARHAVDADPAEDGEARPSVAK